MFIQTEATPNPATLKFLPGRDVLGNRVADFRTPEEAAHSPLAQRLFAIEGVRGVFLGSDFISVTKDDREWPHLKPAILGAVMEHFLTGAPVLDESAAAQSPAASDRRHDQGIDRDPRSSRRGGRWRGHHLQGIS
jgi:hypothetical protein